MLGCDFVASELFDVALSPAKGISMGFLGWK
jgi:hypothetical protein